MVVCVGISPNLEREEHEWMRLGMSIPGFYGGDRTDVALPQPQRELLRAVSATGKPVIVVLLSGSAVAVDPGEASAILAAWYPGEEGGTAIAETLAGDNNPAGRLPVTFYKSVADLPPFDDYSMRNRTYRYFTGQPLVSIRLRTELFAIRVQRHGAVVGAVECRVESRPRRGRAEHEPARRRRSRGGVHHLSEIRVGADPRASRIFAGARGRRAGLTISTFR